ncbi:MAG: hypothetical protein RMM17_04600 [Acidobacteriota bacterium]|nr:putative nuclear RNA export factor SDE5 [Blastocatellia bacterium]MDW8411943.1 hypothetical protein [Acidobacteriota bacterium]
MRYTDRFQQWRKKAEETAKQLDDKFKIKDKIDGSIKAAEDAVRKGAESIGDLARSGKEAFTEHFQQQISQLDERFVEQARAAGEKAAEAFRQSSHKASEVASELSDKAKDYTQKARDYYEKASEAYNSSQAASHLAQSLSQGASSLLSWVKNNPTKATATILSILLGSRLGVAWPNIGTKLGLGNHWFFKSAALALASKKLSEKYQDYLEKQKRLLAENKLSDAERLRLEFELDIAKFVGAPLVAAFNIASGLVILSEIFSPRKIVGFPLELILGANPVLQAVYLFSNGVICIYNGYELIMMAVSDQDEIKNIVREIKALLPEAV